MSRRTFLRVGSSIGIALAYCATARARDTGLRSPTPEEIEGPFYPVRPLKDQDFDLTRVAGKPGVASGTIIELQGRVLDMQGAPVENAIVDIWQANAAGRYRHPRDLSSTPLDPNFQGWAIVPSGIDGGFRFKTILPGSYPASPNWNRPPHVHFKVTKNGYQTLTTQMYFAGQPLNQHDLLLRRKPILEQQRMIAQRVVERPETYRYDIVLQSV